MWQEEGDDIGTLVCTGVSVAGIALPCMISMGVVPTCCYWGISGLGSLISMTIVLQGGAYSLLSSISIPWCVQMDGVAPNSMEHISCMRKGIELGTMYV